MRRALTFNFMFHYLNPRKQSRVLKQNVNLD